MSQARHVILRAPNWLGDAVMALPAMVAMRQHVDGRLTIAARASVAPLFAESQALADQIVVVDRDRETAQLRTIGADTSCCFRTPSERLGRVSERHSGTMGERRGARVADDAEPPRGPKREVHHVQFYLGLMRALGIDAPDAVPRLAVRESTGQRADTLLVKAGVDLSQPIVSFAAGAVYGHAKRWPPDRVAQVVAGLSARGISRCSSAPRRIAIRLVR